MRKRIRNKKIKQKKSVKRKIKQSNNSGFIKLLIWITGIASVVMIGFYAWNFYDHKFSETPSDWGNFGNYIGSITGLLAFVGVLYSLSLSERRSETAEKEAKRREERDIFYKLMDMHQKALQSINIVTEISTSLDTNATLKMLVTYINNLIYDYMILDAIKKCDESRFDDYLKNGSSDELKNKIEYSCKCLFGKQNDYSFDIRRKNKIEINQEICKRISDSSFYKKNHLSVLYKPNPYEKFELKVSNLDFANALKLAGNFISENYGTITGRYFENMRYILKACEGFDQNYFDLYKAQLSRNELILLICYAASDEADDFLLDKLKEYNMLDEFYYKDLYLTKNNVKWKNGGRIFLEDVLFFNFEGLR